MTTNSELRRAIKEMAEELAEGVIKMISSMSLHQLAALTGNGPAPRSLAAPKSESKPAKSKSAAAPSKSKAKPAKVVSPRKLNRRKGAEIEKEDGKLLYVFSFTKPGARGEDEVSVDALTGALHKVEHESAEDEAREAAEDAAKAKGKNMGAGAKGAATGTATKPTKPPVH